MGKCYLTTDGFRQFVGGTKVRKARTVKNDNFFERVEK